MSSLPDLEEQKQALLEKMRLSRRALRLNLSHPKKSHAEATSGDRTAGAVHHDFPQSYTGKALARYPHMIPLLAAVILIVGPRKVIRFVKRASITTTLGIAFAETHIPTISKWIHTATGIYRSMKAR